MQQNANPADEPALPGPSMSRIKILPELLVNKIAAGEVIERPASVVKELIENAVDAGGTQVNVAIEDGGCKLIRVTDNGGGMTAEELRLAVTPHATSKITHEEDLFNIATMGFRGEALPSIGAVSRLTITSRTPESIEGSRIVVAAKHLEASGVAGCRVGTSVEVRDLFFNVPARRKFLRSTTTEVGHVNEQFARLALAHRSIGFELSNNGRITQQLPGGAQAVERIAALFGSETASGLMSVEREERGLHVEAYLAPPAKSRSTATWQYFFLNGRWIRDRFIQHAVREAYRGLIDPSRYPAVFIFLTVDPRLVDVNVHPTKSEVRWQDSNLVHGQVLAAIRDKFLRTDLTPSLTAGVGVSGAVVGPGADAIRQDAAAFLKGVTPTAPPYGPSYFGDAANERVSDTDGPSGLLRSGPASPASVGREVWDALYGKSGGEGQPAAGGPLRDYDPTDSNEYAGQIPRRTIQVHNTYLVTETAEGLVIIDQHALHERIMYERLKARIVGEPLESQRLLLPETMPATARQIAALAENRQLIQRVGIDAEAFGDDSIAIHAFPSVLKDLDVVAFLRDLLDRLSQKGAATHTEEVIHEVLDMMACKAAVKAGDPLTQEEIEDLLRQKEMIEKSSNCPHGRPTTLRLTINDLEKQFKRR